MYKGFFIDRLHVNFDIWVIFIDSLCIRFFRMRRKLVIRFDWPYTTNLNSLGHCLGVH